MNAPHQYLHCLSLSDDQWHIAVVSSHLYDTRLVNGREGRIQRLFLKPSIIIRRRCVMLQIHAATSGDRNHPIMSWEDNSPLKEFIQRWRIDDSIEWYTRGSFWKLHLYVQLQFAALKKFKTHIRVFIHFVGTVPGHIPCQNIPIGTSRISKPQREDTLVCHKQKRNFKVSKQAEAEVSPRVFYFWLRRTLSAIR